MGVALLPAQERHTTWVSKLKNVLSGGCGAFTLVIGSFIEVAGCNPEVEGLGSGSAFVDDFICRQFRRGPRPGSLIFLWNIILGCLPLVRLGRVMPDPREFEHNVGRGAIIGRPLVPSNIDFYLRL